MRFTSETLDGVTGKITSTLTPQLQVGKLEPGQWPFLELQGKGWLKMKSTQEKEERKRKGGLSPVKSLNPATSRQVHTSNLYKLTRFCHLQPKTPV